MEVLSPWMFPAHDTHNKALYTLQMSTGSDREAPWPFQDWFCFQRDSSALTHFWWTVWMGINSAQYWTTQSGYSLPSVVSMWGLRHCTDWWTDRSMPFNRDLITGSGGVRRCWISWMSIVFGPLGERYWLGVVKVRVVLGCGIGPGRLNFRNSMTDMLWWGSRSLQASTGISVMLCDEVEQAWDIQNFKFTIIVQNCTRSSFSIWLSTRLLYYTNTCY